MLAQADKPGAFKYLYINSVPNHAVDPGSSEKARVQIIGLSGSALTSSTGISGILIPISIASPVIALVNFQAKEYLPGHPYQRQRHSHLKRELVAPSNCCPAPRSISEAMKSWPSAIE